MKYLVVILLSFLSGCASPFVREPGGDPDRLFVHTGYCEESATVQHGIGVRF